MRVAAANPDLAPLFGQLSRLIVGPLQHVAVLDFKCREVFVEPLEVFQFATPGDAGEHVVDAEEDPFLAQVHQQRHQIAAALQQLPVLLFADVVDPDVHFGAARHSAGQLFADEEIRLAAQLFGAFDRVMVGQREQIHPAALQGGVDFLGIAITFAANALYDRGCGRPRVVGVDV